MAMKEKALRRLADKLNAAGVVWAVGAGYLSAFRGVAQTYHDFDILVAQSDVETADRVLSKLGMKSAGDDPDSAFHCAYHFDGADIDVMGGLVIRHDGGVWHVPFGGASVAETVGVLGAQVHLMYLEDWYILYSLMGRDSKAEALADHFRRNGVEHPERFALAVAEPLPDDLQASVKTLLEAST